MAVLARDLKIGDRFGTTKSGDPIHIKVLNEVCVSQPSPHVHIVTSGGSTCLPFRAVVGR